MGVQNFRRSPRPRLEARRLPLSETGGGALGRLHLVSDGDGAACRTRSARVHNGGRGGAGGAAGELLEAVSKIERFKRAPAGTTGPAFLRRKAARR